MAWRLSWCQFTATKLIFYIPVEWHASYTFIAFQDKNTILNFCFYIVGLTFEQVGNFS